MKISDPNDKGKQYPIKSLIKDIWFHSGNRRNYLILGSIFRLTGDLAGLYPAYALATIITYVASQKPDFYHIVYILALWFVAALIRFWGLFLAKKYIYSAGHDVWFSVEKMMLSILIAKDSAWHEAESSGVKIKRVERGSQAYKDILYLYVGNYIEIVTRIVGITFIVSRFDVVIGALIAFFIFSYFVISKYLQKRCILAAHKYNVEEDQLGGIVYETISNIHTIRVLDVGSEMINKVSTFINKALTAVYKRIKFFQFRGSFVATYAQLFRILVTGYIVYNILHGEYAIGFIILFSSYFVEIWETMRELMDVSQDMIVGRQSIHRMYDLIGKEIPKESAKENFPESWDALHVKNLTFSYGDNNALRDISFSVKNGEKVGVVGLSGAGKSTLFKLLIRERNDYSGEITIGNVKIQDIKSSDFYRHVSIVPQDTEVFNFSLKENITLAQPGKKEDKDLFDRSIKIGHVSDFLDKLTDGVDTLIGERGVKLSGGERQRLGIARAIFKEPSILLLDEATSHLDLESEEKIKDSLHTFFENVTAIVIAHRLTTIREMDKIIVIENGGIIEQGSYNDLMDKKGRFYKLWQKQMF